MYIIKLCLCIILLFICIYIGKVFSKKLENRTLEYKQLEDILTIIEGKIKYTQDNILNIFTYISGQYINTKWEKLFNEINMNLKSGKYSLKESVKKSVDNNTDIFVCKLDLLNEISSILGKSKVEDQIKNIKLVQERIKIDIKNSIDLQAKNEKVYQNLGVICGIMLVIVLI